MNGLKKIQTCGFKLNRTFFSMIFEKFSKTAHMIIIFSTQKFKRDLNFVVESYDQDSKLSQINDNE